ncbi:MBL fold metallo-hydrolase [Baekduia soli]|uniref:MBL fold metallo-hydrolase n=1 Tax=Baekduia soli TaxID=496014 RepID=A0A5B8U0I2_9ACTN|nr:MBL fold metallo-hydrolase [Baekduia soli]QEC46481.1 MBL fold metallo-hydrolase [Baekduia soli]
MSHDRAITLGRLTVQRIPDMERWVVPRSGVFPTLSDEALAEARERYGTAFVDAHGNIILSVHSWLVRTPRTTILIDTCHGNHKDRRFYPETGNLVTPYLERLRAAGVAPQDVDLVLCTHLHPDHVGWNTQLVDGRWVPTFPRATYLMSETDHTTFSALHASAPEGPAADVARSFADSVLPVVQAGQARFVAAGERLEEELDTGLWLEGAPGHTAGQVALHLESGGRRAIASGDAIHHVLQLADLDLPALGDADPVTAALTRRRLIEGIADTDTLLLPGHVVAPSFGRVVNEGGRLEYAFASGH